MANDAENVRNDLTDLKRDMDALRADLGRLMNSLGQRAQARFAETSEVASRLMTEAERRADGLARDARHQIEERPAATAAVAFGVGLAIGLLLTRRN